MISVEISKALSGVEIIHPPLQSFLFFDFPLLVGVPTVPLETHPKFLVSFSLAWQHEANLPYYLQVTGCSTALFGVPYINPKHNPCVSSLIIN